jgi:sugar lactone lactonase YvrE
MSEAQSGQIMAEPAGEKPKRAGVLMRIVATVVVLLVLLAGYLFLWPAPIDALPYDPPPRPPLEGPLAPNDRLAGAEYVAAGKVLGPEDVELDTEGHIFTGTVDGQVVRIDPDGTVASDGMIYFSDASNRFGHDEYLLDMLEGRPHGRLLRYDPATKETKVLLEGLYFANGVALSQQEDFLLVNETYRFRITRYWLKGDRAGKSDVFVDNLPGFPDNITSNGKGTFWLAIFTVRNEQFDWLSPRPLIKEMLSKLPSFVWPKPEPYGFVIKLDEQGHIQESFQDPTGKRLFAITSVVEHDGALYLGSLVNDRIGKYKLPEQP